MTLALVIAIVRAMVLGIAIALAIAIVDAVAPKAGACQKAESPGKVAGGSGRNRTFLIRGSPSL
jgi:hypothetical protein